MTPGSVADRPLRYVERRNDLLATRSTVGWAIVVAAFVVAALFILFVLKSTLKR